MVDQSEQQAVPVAQINWRLIAKAAGEHGVRYRTNTALLAFLDAIEPARKADRFDPALPCKSGEGADLAVWCAREAEARRAEGNSSPHTAKLTREGRYDDQGVMPVAIEAARIALALTPDATQTREAEGDTVKFVQDWLMNADYDPTQFDKDFAAAIDARKTLTDAELQAAAERFCATPLPETVCADLVAIKPMSGRTGTNLMTVAEAKEMLRAALNARGGA